MSQEPSPDSLVATERTLRRLPRVEKPTIDILLYTDDSEVTDEVTAQWGLGLMLQHINARPPAFGKICIELVNRNPDEQHPAQNRLYRERISKYDQIWFFGVHQINRRNFNMGVLRGGPDSELDDKEVAALKDWMQIGESKWNRGGGVLMTGDHANEPPSDAINTNKRPLGRPGHEHGHFLGLGGALGHRVPRAGRLRKWEGPPTRFKEDSFNTLVLSFGTDVEAGALEIDRVPQQLILETFDEKGRPAEGGRPHPLFFYRLGQSIQIFPDHVHEGAVICPKNFNRREWPEVNNVQPRPQVVAHGIDKRNAQLLKIVAAYNGDCAGVGRIVADSTWHHYFNVNLGTFRFDPDAEVGSASDQLGRYYANLVIWLSSRKARRAMACAMIDWLAHHPTILEDAGLHEQSISDEQKILEALNTGQAAFDIISPMASPCEIHELMQALIPEPCEAFESLYLPDRASALSYLPSKELFLGVVINQYRQQMAAVEGAGGEIERGDVINEVAAAGFLEALGMQLSRLSLAATETMNFTKNL